ncbi:MAG: conjugal transfer protein TraX [Peptococcaceae bacterium]|jgi:hypothetical protein|nr:conjugal transfer protein TraX [Peptococcaceae bacterium]
MLTATALKTIAIVAMLIDHVAYVFLPETSVLCIIMRLIGRVTAPIMFYFVAEGYRKTRHFGRYATRLGIFAAISYIPFVYCHSGALPNAQNWAELNVIYTLFLGLLALRARHEIKSPLIRWAVIGGLILLSVPGDWSYYGILFILVFDHYYGDFRQQAFAYCLITLLMLSPLFTVLASSLIFHLYPFNVEYYLPGLAQLGMFIPIFLLKFYGGQKGGGGQLAKWGFYVFYPAHLLVLALIRDFLPL